MGERASSSESFERARDLQARNTSCESFKGEFEARA